MTSNRARGDIRSHYPDIRLDTEDITYGDTFDSRNFVKNIGNNTRETRELEEKGSVDYRETPWRRLIRRKRVVEKPNWSSTSTSTSTSRRGTALLTRRTCRRPPILWHKIGTNPLLPPPLLLSTFDVYIWWACKDKYAILSSDHRWPSGGKVNDNW